MSIEDSIYKYTPVPGFRPGQKLPVANNIYYVCGTCNVKVPSIPLVPSQCECGNLSGEMAQGLSIKDPAQVNPVKKQLR